MNHLDIVLKSYLAIDEANMQSKCMSHEAVSSLFKTSQEYCCWDDAMLQLDINPPTSIRQVLEDKDKASVFLELPPLSQKKKRPLCTFLNFRGTRRDEEESSIPSLEDDELSSSHMDETSKPYRYEYSISPESLLKLPSIDPLLNDDAKMNQYIAKFNVLVDKIKRIEKELRVFESKRSRTPAKKRRRTI